MTWRMEAKCDNCPFHEAGPGRELRRSLRPGRWRGILAGLRRGGHFNCHKTTGDGWRAGTNLLCAGAIEWQDAQGVSSQMVRIGERLDRIAQQLEREAKP